MILRSLNNKGGHRHRILLWVQFVLLDRPLKQNRFMAADTFYYRGLVNWVSDLRVFRGVPFTPFLGLLCYDSIAFGTSHIDSISSR